VTDKDESIPVPTTAAAFIGRAARHIADALRYWEPRRLFYNAALAAVVFGHLAAAWPATGRALSINVLLGFFVLAVLANICYCAVYVVDFFVQFSGLRDFWAKGRPVVLLVGTAFAALLAHFFSVGIFTEGYND
jgi:hypothetical protein